MKIRRSSFVPTLKVKTFYGNQTSPLSRRSGLSKNSQGGSPTSNSPTSESIMIKKGFKRNDFRPMAFNTIYKEEQKYKGIEDPRINV